MPDYGEIDAMKKIEEALEPLDEGARGRALQWAVSRYRGAKANETGGVPLNRIARSNPDVSTSAMPFENFAELFEAARPNSESDKALIAAYWAQVCQNAGSFASQTLNTELKDLGHGVGNITEALTRLKNERPALVLQLKKSGTSKQARKIYKLTQEGVKRVQSMTGSEALLENPN